jgi:hypothetical protein
MAALKGRCFMSDARHIHVRDEDLELYLLERLETGKTPVLESHLAECDICATKLSSVAFFDQLVELSRKQAISAQAENRREQRISTQDPGILQKINPFSPDRISIQIIDISKGGMQVKTPSPLEPGTMVKVRMKGTIAFGEVRHSRAYGYSFRAGILLYDAFQI